MQSVSLAPDPIHIPKYHHSTYRLNITDLGTHQYFFRPYRYIRRLTSLLHYLHEKCRLGKQFLCSTLSSKVQILEGGRGPHYTSFTRLFCKRIVRKMLGRDGVVEVVHACVCVCYCAVCVLWAIESSVFWRAAFIVIIIIVGELSSEEHTPVQETDVHR